ncbi:hypothetical protein [Luteococcus sp. OSA5]|uniref:hypothetical protein n=1 Tax=Luteococcus sp. OSA5 TaxID=3401630 RepID=UPI003B43272C
MATPKKAAAGVVGGVIAQQAAQLAKDPAVHKAVVDGVKPAVTMAGETVRGLRGKVKTPKKADPFEQLATSLDVVAHLIEEYSPATDPELVNGWRHKVTSLRSAIPLAQVDQGKGRKAKLKDLQSRQKALLDEVYAAIVETHAPAQ